ncbi:MAG: hypothetical protein EKK29_05985 [Hyphomicrobiales bacterium]|nr:MAG: hypothetical protein EKK29_05985 [Hyphomicrobiales bacterium]
MAYNQRLHGPLYSGKAIPPRPMLSLGEFQAARPCPAIIFVQMPATAAGIPPFFPGGAHDRPSILPHERAFFSAMNLSIAACVSAVSLFENG